MKGSCRVKASAALHEGWSSSFLSRLTNFRVQLGHRGQAILLLPVCRVLRLPKNELSTGCVVAEIQPVQYPRVQYPFIDGTARFSGINAADDEINL